MARDSRRITISRFGTGLWWNIWQKWEMEKTNPPNFIASTFNLSPTWLFNVLGTCRILNTCFDFLHRACLQKQQQILYIQNSKFATSKSMSCQGHKWILCKKSFTYIRIKLHKFIHFCKKKKLNDSLYYAYTSLIQTYEV